MAHQIILLEITIDELANLIRQAVSDELSRTIAATQNDNSYDILLNIKDAAAFLSVSIPTIHTWRRQGLISSYRIGSAVRFKRSELEQSLRYYSPQPHKKP